MKMEDWLVGMIVCVLVMIVIMIALGSFETDSHGIEGEYCIQSGGQWTFYECSNSSISNCSETSYWCIYPDGTNKSENQISYMINSTAI